MPARDVRRRLRPSRLHVAFASTLAVAVALGAGACGDGQIGSMLTGSTQTDGAAPTGSGPPGSSSTGDAATTGDGGVAVTPFAPDSPYTYVAKVKNLLIGLPPTDAEMKTIVTAADPQQALKTLITQTWMPMVDPYDAEGRTYYVEKMLAFFMQATQQTQINATDFQNQVGTDLDVNKNTPLLVQNAVESFARTMIDELVAHGQSTQNVVTTTSFMMTTALMETYGFLDSWQVNDSGGTVDQLAKKYPGQNLYIGSATVALGDSVDVTNSKTFMHFTDPDVAPGGVWSQIANNPSACVTDPLVLPLSGISLHHLLYGTIQAHKEVVGTTTSVCPQFGGSTLAPVIGNTTGATNDFNDWRMVTIRQPKSGEATTAFYDIPTLRKASTLVLDLPRTGFFTTPAFFANWQTNASNTMRVTMNQTLIVALGAMYDGADSTPTPVYADGGIPGLDPVHDTGACFSCHRLLDPGRSLLASTYSWNYHTQDMAAFGDTPGMFAFQGTTTSPTSVYDLASTLSTHPYFATAWVQKLCYYVNSQACEPNDMEFARLVKDFGDSSYSWNDLVVDVLTSPITTNAVATQTNTDQGVVVAVSRLGHFCKALDFRLQVNDICGLVPTTTALSKTVVEIAGGLPSDGYGRGSPAPVLPNLPSLFYRSGTENICQAIAPLVVDPVTSIPNARSWSSTSATNVSAALKDFVELIMGIVPSDPRHDPLLAMLQAHYDKALAAVDPVTDASDFKPTTALQSAFVAACLAPSSVGIGM